MKITFRPEAKVEILEAQAWYESRSPGLGFDFARAIEVAVETILTMPLAYPKIEDEFRHIILSRFPYSIIYHYTESELVVVS